MKLKQFKKYKVLDPDTKFMDSHEEICSNLLYFLQKCRNDKISILKIVIEAPESTYLIISPTEEIESDNTYDVVEEIE